MHVGLILAGGTGRRMGREMPKQFIRVAGKPLLLYSLETFNRHPLIDGIGVVCLKQWQPELRDLAAGIQKLRWIADARDTRSLSSYHGLLAMQADLTDEDIVLIHDAARPFVTPQIISDNLETVKRTGACNTAIPSVDTILQSDDGQQVGKVLDRSVLYSSQTPQSFRYGIITEAYRKFFSAGAKEATCDCSVAKQAGFQVELCHGSRMNMKVTTGDDLLLAKMYAREFLKKTVE